MALKKKISKTEFEALKPEVQALYKKDGEDAYKVDLDGDDDPVELKRAKDREKQRADELQAKIDEIEAKRENDDNDKNKKAKDIDALEKSWKAKADKDKEASDKVAAGLRQQIETHLVTNVAQTLAGKISKSPALILPHITSRLRVEYDSDGKAMTRILDKEGKISALSVTDLEAELVANKDFSSIIIGSKATGGARLQTHGNAAVPTIPGNQPGNQPAADLSKVPAADMVARIKERKENARANE